jgi:PKD repeat protein
MKRKGFIRNFSIFIVFLLMLMLPSIALASDYPISINVTVINENSSTWPQFQKDEVNSGITNDSAPIANPSSSESWVVDTVIPSGGMAGIDSTPIVYNGSVYVVTSEANLVKYSLDGTPAGGFWPVNFATAGTYDFQNGGMAACNGYIYLVDSGCVRYPDYDLYAIDADTGTIVDRKNVTDSRVQFSTPITYVNDSSGNKHILFGSVNTSSQDTVNPNDGGKYYCYNVSDPSNPVKEWGRNCSSVGRYYWGYYWAGAAVIGNYAVYGDDNGHLVSVNYTNFANNEVETIQEINASTVFGSNVKAIRSSISYSEETGRIYFTSLAGYCHSLGFNANTGQFNTASNWSSDIGYSTSTPAYYNGRVYVGNNNGYSEGNLWCLSASDGAEIWSTSVGPVQSSPAISAFYGSGNEYIYVTTNSGSGGIYCVNSTGSIVWHNTSVGSNKYCLAGAAISGGWVYYGNDDGYLLGLTASDQESPVAPTASFSADPVSGLIPLNVQFTDLSTGDGITNWAWDFDSDGTVDSTAQNPTWNYTNAGTYTVSLTVTNAGGSNTKTKNNYITANEATVPTANFSADPVSGYIPLNVQFTDLSTGDEITSWAWDFDSDGTVDSTAQNPTWNYTNAGTYTVSLTVTNAGGSNTKTKNNYITVNEAVTESEWTQFHKDAAHTGFALNDVSDTNNSLWISDSIWAVPSSSPVIVDGKVFVKCGIDESFNNLMSTGGGEYRIVILNEPTGEYLTNSSIEELEISWSSPCYYNGTIWSGRGVGGAGGATAAAGKIFDSNDTEHRFYCTDAASKAELWNFPVTGNIRGNAAYSDGKVYMASGWLFADPGYVYCVDAETGTEIWNKELSYEVSSSPTVSDGVVYVSTYDGDFYALDAETGTEIWNKRLDSTDVSSTAAVAYGNVYISGGCPGISTIKTYCFNASSGDLVWSTSAGDEIGGWSMSVAVAEGKVFVGKHAEGDYFGHNTTLALNASTGEVIWTAPYGGASPAISDGIVFTIGYDGRVYAFKDPLPVADFTSNVTNGKEPLAVRFTDTSTGSPTSWLWDFGDGASSDEQNPVHTYTSAGTYSVKLTVTGPGGTDEELKSDYITVNELTQKQPDLIVSSILPSSNITANASCTICATLNNNGTDEAEAFNSSLFVNGTLVDTESVSGLVVGGVAEINFSWTPEMAGNYSLKVKADSEADVSESDETNNELTILVTVSAAPEIPTEPVANFTANVTSGKVPLAVRFTDTSTGTPTSWSWDFDSDGVTDSDKQNPAFTYENPGNYTVKLTVANSNGTDTETKVNYITVKALNLPVANFSVDRYNGTCPLIVQFTNLSQRAEEWNWDFDNDKVIDSKEQNPKFTYTNAGNYTVNLTVSNSDGTDYCTAEIVVKEFKSQEENYSVSLEEEIEDINDTTKEIVINSSSSVNITDNNTTIKISNGKLNISIHTDGVKEEGDQLKGNYTNATIETASETYDLGGNLSSVSSSLNATLSENLSALLKGNASITTTVVPGAPDNETASAFLSAGADFAEDMEIAYSLVINKIGLDGVTIKDAYISMSVPKTYVDSHGGTDDFTIMSLHEGSVKVLETSVTESGDYYVFTAYSPDGFSVKALVSYTPKTETQSSHKSGGGGGSFGKLSVIPVETPTSSSTESETSVEEQETETEKMEITPVNEDKENNKPAGEAENEKETESKGIIPGFEAPLAVLGILLVIRAKRRD